MARKGKPGSTKDKVSVSPTKQTVLGFFDNKGKCTPTCAQGHHSECRLHCWCPGEVLEGSSPEMTRPGAWGVGFSTGPTFGFTPYRKCRDFRPNKAPSWFPTPSTPWTCSCWLFLPPHAQEGAGRPNLVLGWVQDAVGGGHRDGDQR
jgi:hypothetical protein